MGQPAVLSQPGVVLASPERRLAAFVLDIPLFAITLGVGWFIWYLIVAQSGLSPAKQILGIHIVREDGERAGLGRILLRDLVPRGVGMYALMWAVVPIGLAGFWVACASLPWLRSGAPGIRTSNACGTRRFGRMSSVPTAAPAQTGAPNR